jgi:hypothetical protein
LGDETGKGETLDRPMGMEIRRLAQWLEGAWTVEESNLEGFRIVGGTKKKDETPGKGCLFGDGLGSVFLGEGEVKMLGNVLFYCMPR